MMELTLVVFDLAGTTVQATDQVPAAFAEAFRTVGIALTADEISAIRGKAKREAIGTLLSRYGAGGVDPELTEQVYTAFQRIVTDRYTQGGVRPIDGAAETIQWLRAHGIKTALSTGFDRTLVDLLINLLGWQGLADAVVCNEDVPAGRPAPYLIFRAMEWTNTHSVHQVAAVGDTVADLEAAYNAGVDWSIGVLSGAHRADQLRAYPHTALLESVQALPALLQTGKEK